MRTLASVTKYDELEEYLRDWRSSFDSEDAEYDFVGMVCLLRACLDNLSRFALDSELEDIGSALANEQRAFLVRLGEFASK